MNPRSIHNYLKIVVGATFILIVAGGLVTSTGSGLSVPDWPLSYGQIFPPMIGGIRFEHTHRLIAGTVGILTLILTILLFKNEPRVWVKRLGALALGAVILQAVLGGLTVIYLLPTAVSVFHACLAQTFFALVVSLAYFTSSEWHQSRRTSNGSIRSVQRLLCVTIFFIYTQLVLGSIVRHTAGGAAVNFHIGVAFLVIMHIVFIMLRIFRDPAVHAKLGVHVTWLFLLALGQIFLGAGAYIMKFMLQKPPAPTVNQVLLTTAHQTGGALVLAVCVVLAIRAYRLFEAGLSHA